MVQLLTQTATQQCPAGFMHGGYFGMMGLGWLFQIIIFVIFFLVVWWVLRTSQQGKDTEDPHSILKRRLAKGEITKKEYESLKKEIG